MPGLTACHTSTSIARRKTWHFLAFPHHVTILQVTMDGALLAAAPRSVQQMEPPLRDHGA